VRNNGYGGVGVRKRISVNSGGGMSEKGKDECIKKTFGVSKKGTEHDGKRYGKQLRKREAWLNATD